MTPVCGQLIALITKVSINLTPIRMVIPNHFCNRRYL